MSGHERIVGPEDAPLTIWHWAAGAALAMALVIDIMKPASSGFVTPGMQVEYGVSPHRVAILPAAALCGNCVAGRSFYRTGVGPLRSSLRRTANVRSARRMHCNRSRRIN